MSLLKLENVSYVYKNRYQSVKAVNDVTFEFEEGKVYAIVGKSGSGKTTTLSMLAGLDLPTSGKVVFDGKSTDRINRDRYRREDIAVIYQGFNLFPLLTVLENVMYPMRLQGVKKRSAKQQAYEKLKLVGLEEKHAKRFPSMLSGGEQQRVAIARALAANSRVILADEPTGNLDVENSRNIVDILTRLAHDLNYCVIIVTHDMAIADRADIVMRMVDGRIIEEAPPAEEEPDTEAAEA